MSIAKQGTYFSPEWCQKLSEAHTGVPWSALRRDRFEARKAAQEAAKQQSSKAAKQQNNFLGDTHGI